MSYPLGSEVRRLRMKWKQFFGEGNHNSSDIQLTVRFVAYLLFIEITDYAFRWEG
jgi:hypothetical protein